jgi:hypothetical protein
MMYHEDRGWGIDTSGDSGGDLGDRLEAIESRLAELETGKGE